MAKKYYAVRKGLETGIFEDWDTCRIMVAGYSGAEYKSFKSLSEAEAYMGTTNATTSVPTIDSVISEPTSTTAVAYVDGSYVDGAFSYGAVIAHNSELVKLSQKMTDTDLATMHNVAGEIKGAEAAIQYAVEHDCKDVWIYYDYNGIELWATGEWKAKKSGTQEYKAFCDSMRDKIEIHFVKVKGHSGDKYNDMADLLAKQALGLS